MLTKQQAKSRFLDYLRQEHIQYKLLNETGGMTPLDDIDTVYLSCEIPEVIGKRIETSVRFMEEHCYVQSYYCQSIVKNEEQAIKAARMCNYMNYHLQWGCNTLFDHQYILHEEEGDIFNGCLIRYEFLEDGHFYDAMNHILNFSVQQIADVCIPVIFHLTGKFSYDDFKKYLNDHIIGR